MKYRKQKWKSRRQLHPLYERILRNHLHNLTQEEIAAARAVFSKLPANPQELTSEYIENVFADMTTPVACNLLNRWLQPLGEALGPDPYCRE